MNVEFDDITSIGPGDWDDSLKAAMKAVSDAEGINLHGKIYKPVSVRVEAFRTHFGVGGRLRVDEFTETEFPFEKDGKTITHKRLRMRAVVELWTTDGWQLVAEGYAEEVRGASSVNIKSACENCETSAYGRALANLGLIGGEYASANEMEFESLVSKIVTEIRAYLDMDLDENLVAKNLYELDKKMAGNNELGIAVNDRLQKKTDGAEFNERDAFRKFVAMGRKLMETTLPNGRAKA